ncbi:MAG: hypothetical protein Q9214_003770 [Letrouitia sp. 1 TL-2023]
MKQWLEMEIGITGGEEDGVNNEGVDNNSLYTQPEDIYEIYSSLSKISPYFSIAAAFGNVHGVYSPGNVKLHPDHTDLIGVRDHVLTKKDYLASQVGNPEGEGKPNKKYYDPRVWVREGEKTMTARVKEALKDFNTASQL